MPSAFYQKYASRINAAPDTNRTFGQKVSDTGVSLISGAASTIGLGGDLYGLITNDMDNWASDVGDWGREFAATNKSPELLELERIRDEKVAAADGTLAKMGVAFWETIKSPSLLTSFAVEQAPNLVMTGGVGGLAGKAALKGALAKGLTAAAARQVAVRAGTGGAVAAGAAMQGADAGSQAYDQLISLPQDIWDQNEEFRSAVESGVDPEEAKNDIAIRYARGTGASSAATSALLNYIIPGAAKLERRLATGPLAGSRLTNMASGFAGEALQEGLEEGSGVYLANLATSALDANKDLWEGVGEATGLGFVSGVFGAMSGIDSKPERTNAEISRDIFSASSVDAVIDIADQALGKTEYSPQMSSMDLDSPASVASLIDTMDLGKDLMPRHVFPELDLDARNSIEDGFKATQRENFLDLDSFYESAQTNQQRLALIGDTVEGMVEGVSFKNPKLKKRTTAEQKMAEKYGNDLGKMTDIVRGGFFVDTPQAADQAVDIINRQFEVIDESWNINPVGFFDRKLLVRFKDGMVGEFQMWHPDMAAAKMDVNEAIGASGQDIYTELRDLDRKGKNEGLTPEEELRFDELMEMSVKLYSPVLGKLTQDQKWSSIVTGGLQALADKSPNWADMLSGYEAALGSNRLTMDSTSSLDATRELNSASDINTFSQLPLRNAQASRFSITTGSPSSTANVSGNLNDIKNTSSPSIAQDWKSETDKNQENSPFRQWVPEDAPARLRAKQGVPGIGVERATSAVKPLLTRLNQQFNLNIQIVDDVDSLPAGLQSRVAREDRVKGIYDGKNVFLLANNLESEHDAEVAMAHELVGHKGVLEVLDKQGWQDLKTNLQEVVNSDDKLVKDMLQEVDRRYGTEINEDTRLKELLAIAAERRVKDGKIGQLVRQFKELIQRGLKAVGFKGPFAASELDIILSNSEKHLKKAGEAYGKPVRSSRQFDPATAGEPEWRALRGELEAQYAATVGPEKAVEKANHLIDRLKLKGMDNLGNQPVLKQAMRKLGYNTAESGAESEMMFSDDERTEYQQAVDKGLDMSEPARMERAKQMGFSEKVYYHGTKQDIKGFVPGYDDGLIFLADNPSLANEWIGKGKYQQRLGQEENIARAEDEDRRIRREEFDYKKLDQLEGDEFNAAYDEMAARARKRTPVRAEQIDSTVYPVRLRATKTFDATKEYKKIEPFLSGMKNMSEAIQNGLHKTGNWAIYENKEVIAELKRMGYDSILINENAKGPQETIAVFDPSQIRSVNAAFDPDYQESANILRSQPEQNDPVLYSKRDREPPKKTRSAYKLFRVDPKNPGKLFPLFVNAKDEIEVGTWYDADNGPMQDGKVKSKIGKLSYRPGWHAGTLPFASQIGSNRVNSKPTTRRANEVWAEVEFADDVDYTEKVGKNGMQEIPVDGTYEFNTSGNVDGTWLISGAMKVKRVLGDEEVAKINSDAGTADYPREGGVKFVPAEYGFEEPIASKPERTDGEKALKLAEQRKREKRRSNTKLGEYMARKEKDGSLLVFGDIEEIRAQLPDGIKGRIIDGALSFTANMSPRVERQLRGEEITYGRGGKITKHKMKDGKYVGAPPTYDTPQKIPSLRKRLRQLATEGEAGRFWYENSGEAILYLTGGDKAEAKKFVSLLAIYSPQAKVDANSTFALRAWAQYKAGQPIKVKTGVQDAQAAAVLYDGAAWKGEKTNNFYRNLMKEIEQSSGDQGATIDMWMMRAGDYDHDAPTTSEYAFMENETNRLAEDLGWEPQQTQAAIWVAMKARMENAEVKRMTERSSEKEGWIKYRTDEKGKVHRVVLDQGKHMQNWIRHAMKYNPTEKDTGQAKFDFADGVRRHIGQVSWEARPSTSLNILPGIHSAPYEQKLEFQKAFQEAFYDAEGNDRLAMKLGILVDSTDVIGPGPWQGVVSPSQQTQVAIAPNKSDIPNSIDPAQKTLLDLYSAAVGLIAGQDGVSYHKPFYKAAKKDSNGAEFHLGREITAEETAALEQAKNQAFGAMSEDVGIIPVPDGFRIINFSDEGSLNHKEFDTLLGQTISAMPAGFDVNRVYFASDGNLVKNNWERNADGQNFVNEIRRAGRSDLLRWIADEFSSLQSVYDEYSAKYSWGEPGDVAGRLERAADPDLLLSRPDPARDVPGSSSGDRKLSALGGVNLGGRETDFPSTVEAIHYGKQRVLTLRGDMNGTGIRGAEARRLAGYPDERIRNRVYFYARNKSGNMPAVESGLGPEIMGQKFTNVAATNDAITDLWGRAVLEQEKTGENIQNLFESMVVDQGYDGYMNPSTGHLVILNHDVPVEYLGNRYDLQKEGVTGNELVSPPEPAPDNFLFSRADPLNSARFKNWFGDSKVLNDNGEPLRVYHATTKSFSEFIPGGLDPELSGKAIWLTDNPQSQPAMHNIKSRGEFREGANVMPVYVKMEKPLLIDDQETLGWAREVFAKGSKEFPQLMADDWISEVTRDGEYDGVIFDGPALGWDGADREYIVFNPGQVKSAIGNSGSFNADTNNILFSRPGSETYDRLAEKFGLIPVEKKTLTQSIKEVMNAPWKENVERWGNRLYEGIFEGFHPILRAEREQGIGTAAGQFGSSPFAAFKRATRGSDMMSVVLEHSGIKMEDGSVQLDNTVRPLLDIFNDLGADMQDWLIWMGANRANELSVPTEDFPKGRENNLTREEIEAGMNIAAGDPARAAKFEQVRQDYIDAVRSMLDFGESTGIVNPETRSQWESGWYVPFFRQTEGDAPLLSPRTKRGIVNQAKQIRRLRGSKAPTQDLLQNILVSFATMVDKSIKNDASLKFVDSFIDSGLVTKESLRWKPKANTRDAVAALVKEDAEMASAVRQFLGLDEDASMQETLDELETIPKSEFPNLWSAMAPTDPDVIRVMRNGQYEYYRVNDESLSRAVHHLSTMGFQKKSSVRRAAMKMKHWLTVGVTASPEFMMRNFIRDSMQTYAITPDGFKLGFSSVKGLKDMIAGDEDYWRMLASGGAFGSGLADSAGDPEAFARTIRRHLKRKGMSAEEAKAHMQTMVTSPQGWKDMMVAGWEKYRHTGDIIENSNRLARFKLALENGKTMAEAAFISQDTMDFGARGSFEAVQLLADILPFFNARLQGLSKLGRAAKDDPAHMGKAVMMIAGASILLAAANADDDRYKELPDWDKDSYWHFWAGDQHFRIPKPFELGFLAATMPERMYSSWTGQAPSGEVMESFLHGLAETLNFNPIPQAILPLAEVVANRSFYFDTPIESMSDQNRLPVDRYNSRTSNTAVAIGQVTGRLPGPLQMSPKQVEHLVQGYFGTMGQYALELADFIVRKATGAPERPSMRLKDAPVVRALYRGDGSSPSSSQYMTDFYDYFEEVTEIWGSVKERAKTDPEAALKLATKERDKLATRSLINRVQRRMSELRQTKERIANDRTMTSDQKRRRIDEIDRMMNQVAKQAARQVEDFF